MGLIKFMWVVLHCWVLSLVFFKAYGGEGSEVSVKFLKAPHAFSRFSSAKFSFQILVGGNEACSDRDVSCKLDAGTSLDCGSGEVMYTDLKDGNHSFQVCGNASQRIGCSTHNWIVDTTPPTAYVTAPSSLTNAENISVDIFFSEPCNSGGGFQCSSVNACNLLVYGAGEVIPSSLITIQPNLRYSVLVGLSSTVQYGRIILVMDRNFCRDTAGNLFTRTENSSFYVHFDRRSVYVNLRSRVPERLLRLDSQTRTVQATNNNNNLKVYLYFSQPVLNSSSEILNSLDTSQGILIPIRGESLANRRFGFMVTNISNIAIITISLDSKAIISSYGTPISPINPVTFLYDSQRPAVRLSTIYSMRTRQPNLPILITFVKPVFGFNTSSISISGGHLQSFREISQSIYLIDIQAVGNMVYINVPENVTGDVAGNKNLPSNVLQVMPYSVPIISYMTSTFATASFFTTSFAVAFLTVSTASLISAGAFSKPSSSIMADPARSLFRTAFYIQVFALSRWLAVTLPVEYYELVKGIQWSIPYMNLPWETEQHQQVMVGPSTPDSSHSYISKFHDLGISQIRLPGTPSFIKADAVYGLPLTSMEYRSYFESQDMKPEADYLDSPHLNGWRDFYRIIFWLAVIVGSLLPLHALTILILKLKRSSQKKWGYGAITFPRLEIFLLVHALPSISKAAATLVRGGETSGAIVGILLLVVVSFLLLSLLLFLSVGIMRGKLLQYKEVHHEGQKSHWYQEIIRVTLGPGKRGQWTWKDQPNSIYITIFGPLFEDLRGPPKYMLSQISGSNRIRKHDDRLMASDDENEDAEAPFIQKVFGILRIYYTLLEAIKRVSLGILAGAYSNDRTRQTPTVVLLSITSFQLFFMVLKKPFIKKKVQLVEIISLSCQVGIFASCLVLLKKELSSAGESKLGVFMLILFLLGFLAQITNEWCALYRQTKMLDFSKNSFFTGLKIALSGFLLLILPKKLLPNLESKFPLDQCNALEPRDFSSSADQHGSSGSRSSGSTDKPWLKQLRELAKSSFTKDGNGARNVASTSQGKWSGFWGLKKSGSSSMNPSSDFKAKPEGLYKDLEAIFASK